MRILFATAPGYGLTLPLIPMMWAARTAGHEVLLATTSEMTEAGARAGLAVYDVFPARDVWGDLMRQVMDKTADHGDEPEEYRLARQSMGPFGLFTASMTAGTIEAGRVFRADLVAYSSDHAPGMLTAAALGVPGLEIGNRVSWSTRDVDWSQRADRGEDEVTAFMRTKLGIGDRQARVIARIDPRAPSMGGLGNDEQAADARDGVPWWPMSYVPYNGGAVVPPWALQPADRPRIAVTLGTVVPVMTGVSNLRVVIEALGAMEVDVVLAAGTTDLTELGELPDNVSSVGYLPLSTFLPGCAAIVHHGGSGTTAAPLYYGIPQLVLPSFADNPMSAQRVVDRGVGLSHDPATVDVDTVRELVDRLLSERSFADAAAEVSAEMAAQPSPAIVLARAVAALN
ncbi:nucleotide disphospho-sugar-binding domain-containing protein [Microlunatus soli]|uniref:UDP:flavonoid glycosyltransferase YjiC, YdhE family n=1 Tax=Microlunatus soli TaxID=630515 RepID=A0A1H1ZYC5_9ACTN|nr:nucleotide disphospho-sugar-binding domain-containing protein [Microlunatus soli]SDT38683.1 UDP:flavonoid glycosyltransferase YjiC, YdhE family [Microlunatus soli]